MNKINPQRRGINEGRIPERRIFKKEETPKELPQIDPSAEEDVKDTAGEPVKEETVIELPQTDTSAEEDVKDTDEDSLREDDNQNTIESAEMVEKNTTSAPPASDNSNENMDAYFNCYPREKVFYRTTDGQVFLSDDASVSYAKNHQRKLKGELQIIKRK